MSIDNDQPSLPLRGTLTPIYILSFIVAVLVAAASTAGLFLQRTLYATDDLLQSFLPNDVVHLIIGLPILLVSLWLTYRGRRIGLLLWPGALFYFLYDYLVYVLAMPLNAVKFLYLGLVAISASALVVLLVRIDKKDVQQKLSSTLPVRLCGGILIAFGVLFFLRAASILIAAFTGQSPIARAEIALNTTDLLISPVWVVCGWMLWKRKAFGYATGLGMLFQASMLFIGLIIFLLLQPILTAAPFVLIDVLVVFAMGLVCFIPFGLFVRGVLSGRP
jgi:hypothetical protein